MIICVYTDIHLYLRGQFYINIENRVDNLEKLVEVLKEELDILKTKVEQQEVLDERGWKRNSSGDYMIKIFYPGIFSLNHRNKPIAGFPKNRKKLSKEIKVGQYMFIYVTSPIKKIIGLGKVISIMQTVVGNWPYAVPFEWVIKPKSGISFEEAGIDIRVRVGDTLFSLDKDKADKIIEKLCSQLDMSDSTMDYLNDNFEKR